MFHDRSLNNKINSIHERALKITYADKISTFHLNGIVLFQYTIEICRYWQLQCLQLKTKSKIKNWIPFQCSCRLCRTYLPQIAFVMKTKNVNN